MNHHWRRFLALLLTLTTVLSLLPAGFALEDAGEAAAAQESLEEPAGGTDEAVSPEIFPDAEEAALPEVSADTEESASPEPSAEEDESAPQAVPVETEESAPSEAPAVSTAGASRQAIPSPSAGSYDQLTLEGTWDYASAFAVQELINDALTEEGKSILMMDKKVLDSAMTRAAELAVCFREGRPSGEDWSTVLGDAGVKATLYVQAIHAGAETAQQVFDVWTSDSSINEALLNEDSRSLGIGCFSQTGGTRYWVLIVTDVLSSPISSHENVTDVASVDYRLSALGSASLTLSKTALNVGETIQASFAISNGSDSFVPTGDMISYSSNSDAITVNSQGLVSAKQPGSATITGSLKGTSKTDSVSVTSTLNLPSVTLAVANQNGGVKISWKPVTGATSYDVYRTKTFQRWPSGSQLCTVSADQLYYVDKTVTSGSTYYYTVRACYDGETGRKKGSYDPSGMSILYLATPKLTSAKASSTGINLQWGAVTGAKGYDVYRKAGDATKWTKVASVGAVTSYVDSNVTAKTKYTYTVRAKSGSVQSYYVTGGISATPSATVKTETYVVRSDVNYRSGASTSSTVIGRFKAGTKINVISGWSTTANGVTWYMINLNGSLYYVQAPYLLGTPKITAVTNAPDGLKVTWSKVSNGAGYLLYYRNSSGGWSRIATIDSSSTVSYVVPDSKLTSGKSYTFTVKAYYGKITGGYDNTGSSGTYLKTPELSSAVSNDKDTITVTWEKVAGAEGYILYRKTSGTSWSAVATIKSDSTTSYKDTSVTTMTTYTYTVRAYAGKLRSSYVSSGISAIIIPSDKLVSYVVASDVKYRTGPSTDYKSLGTLKAGTTVQVISGWSKTASGFTWFKVKMDNTIRYVASDFLLGTPKLGSITAKSGGLTVTWNKVAHATGYALYRKTPSSKWSRIANLNASTLSYTDDSLSSGTTYVYTVRAAHNSILSRYDTKGLSLCYLTTPKLTSAAASDKGITINWSRVTGAQGYYIYRKQSGGSWSRIAQVNSGSTISYQDKTNMLKGVTYLYTVRAFSGSSYSYYQTSGISAKATVTLKPVTKDYVTTGKLNYRDKPGTSSDCKIKGTLEKGTTVEVIPDGTTKVGDSTWYMIWLNGKTYYASAKYLKVK